MRVRLTLQYDGSSYYGWQVQPGRRTVEGEIESVLSQILQHPIDVVGQGRTDRGVHALGQTAHADLPDGADAAKLRHSANQLLPKDIHLLRIESVREDFHARFDALSRRYAYRLTMQPDVLRRHTSLHLPWLREGHVDLLQQIAGEVIGEHDFSRFSRPPEDHPTGMCTVLRSEWVRQGDDLVYVVEANRFLRHLVRRFVGTMLDLVQHGENEQTISEELRRFFANGGAGGADHHAVTSVRTAPAHALTLMEVRYP